MGVKLSTIFDVERPRVHRRVRATLLTLYSLMVVLTVAVLVVDTHTLEVSTRGAEIINLAGRQRMLSQRVALLSHKQHEDPLEFSAPLQASVLRLIEASREYSIRVLLNALTLFGLLEQLFQNPSFLLLVEFGLVQTGDRLTLLHFLRLVIKGGHDVGHLL